MSQDVKLHIFQYIHTPSGNRLTGSYFRSITGYDTQTSFTALIQTVLHRVFKKITLHIKSRDYNT